MINEKEVKPPEIGILTEDDFPEAEITEIEGLEDDSGLGDELTEEQAQELAQRISQSPFVFLMKSVQLLDIAWDHAVGKDDFDKMLAVVEQTMSINDRYMAATLAQGYEGKNGRDQPFGFVVQA